MQIPLQPPSAEHNTDVIPDDNNCWVTCAVGGWTCPGGGYPVKNQSQPCEWCCSSSESLHLSS